MGYIKLATRGVEIFVSDSFHCCVTLNSQFRLGHGELISGVLLTGKLTAGGPENY